MKPDSRHFGTATPFGINPNKNDESTAEQSDRALSPLCVPAHQSLALEQKWAQLRAEYDPDYDPESVIPSCKEFDYVQQLTQPDVVLVNGELTYRGALNREFLAKSAADTGELGAAVEESDLINTLSNALKVPGAGRNLQEEIRQAISQLVAHSLFNSILAAPGESQIIMDKLKESVAIRISDNTLCLIDGATLESDFLAKRSDYSRPFVRQIFKQLADGVPLSAR